MLRSIEIIRIFQNKLFTYIILKFISLSLPSFVDFLWNLFQLENIEWEYSQVGVESAIFWNFVWFFTENLFLILTTQSYPLIFGLNSFYG